MIVLGLTGSIGMGKSTAATQLRRIGLPVFDADREVHALLATGGAAVRQVADAFPGIERAGEIDRARLGGIVFADAKALRRLEAILHPMVGAARQRFLARTRRRRLACAVLDLPLLFEGGNELLCDRVAVVTCPAFLQRQRAMARPGMDEKKFKAILARQMPDAEKRRHAHYIVQTGLGLRYSLRNWIAISAALRGEEARWQGPRCAK